TIIVTMIITFTIYMMLLIWGRFKDKEDLTKLGATPLPDNNPRDKYLYEIMVMTGGKNESETKSVVQFILSGSKGETTVRTFADYERQILKKNGVDIFVMAVPDNLGNLEFLRIWHDNSGKCTSFMKYMVFYKAESDGKRPFICNNAYQLNYDDIRVSKIIVVTHKKVNQFFEIKFRNEFFKNFVFAELSRVKFTRVQRITTCMALLYLTMVTNAMFYGVIPEEPGAGAFSLGPFSMSPAAIGVGVISNLITFPPLFLIIQLFRKVSPKYKR
ncbi:unnamed protein product, partial [Meganyctiphanes norvegica]